MSTANINKLIDHYSALPELPNWGYEQCVAGVLESLGITEGLSNQGVADALGVTYDEARQIIAGPTYIEWDSWSLVKRRDQVVAMLEGLLEVKDVDWNRIRNAPKN